MKKQLKQQLITKLDGKTMKWFFDHYIKEKTGLTYGGFMLQINGYTKNGLSKPVAVIVEKFLSDCPE